MIRNMKEEGTSNREIVKELGISMNTMSKMLKTNRVKEYQSRKRSSKLDPYREKIKEFIGKYNLSSVRILEEIRWLGYDGGYTILKDYCSKTRKDHRVQAVYRYETEPGKQSQVDFGEFGYIDMDGKRGKLYAFSIILGNSRMRYAEFTTDISTENVIKMHLNAFRFFGGYTGTILFDNMKQVVLERRINASGSVFNRKFRDFSEYCGFIVRLCFPYRAQTKGKIENTIKYLRYNIVVFCRMHQIPKELLAMEKFNHVDRAPEYFTSKEETRKVSRDCYVSLNGNRYSVPWIYAGKGGIGYGGIHPEDRG